MRLRGSILYVAHRAIESVTLDKETMHAKERVMPIYSELIYNGYWFSKKRIALQKIIDKKRYLVAGQVVLKIFKGNIIILSRRTNNKAYSVKKVPLKKTNFLIKGK